MAFQVPPLWQAAFSLKHLLAQKWARKWTLWVVLNLVWTNCGTSEVSPCWSHSHELFDLWRRWWGLCLHGNRHGSCAPGCMRPCSNTGWKGSDPASGEGAQTLPPHTYIPGEHLPGTQVLEKPLCRVLLVDCTMVCFHVHSFMLFCQTKCLCAFPQLDLTTWSFPCSFCICILPGGLSSTAEDMDIHRSDGHFSSFLCLLPSQGCGVSSRRGEQGRNSFHWSVLIL